MFSLLCKQHMQLIQFGYLFLINQLSDEVQSGNAPQKNFISLIYAKQ